MLDFEEEMNKAAQSPAIEKNYKLLVDQVIAIGNERFRASSSLVRLEAAGIHGTLRRQNRLGYPSRPLRQSGGSTTYPGLADYMHEELANLAPRSIKECVLHRLSARYADSLIGANRGSSREGIFGQDRRVHPSFLVAFPEPWILKREYDEFGSQE
ncbi:cytoplasmic 1 [Moniliophthora roreri]|nr:cytoplasmic 1 [Moniliophthora roreri]